MVFVASCRIKWLRNVYFFSRYVRSSDLQSPIKPDAFLSEGLQVAPDQTASTSGQVLSTSEAIMFEQVDKSFCI